MRVLITGAKGMLGSKVCEVLNDDSFCAFETDISGCDIYMDITDPESIASAIRCYKPTSIIHCAAMTDVAGCTSNPDLAFKINTIGTRNLAIASEKANIHLINLSTVYVFDGKEPSYTEFSPTCPINIYGLSKLMAEEAIKESTHKFTNIRTNWLFAPTHSNFVKTIFNKLKEDKPIEVVTDQFGSPTNIKDLALFIKSILGTTRYGTYHFSNSGSCSRYLFAKKVQELSGYMKQPVLPTTEAKLDRFCSTLRPRNSVLQNYRLELEGYPSPRPWEDALSECITELKELDARSRL
jgi:dTDP-4-dehydrorhamnose reductase